MNDLSLIGKIVVIGKTGVGKSALVERLTQGVFSETYKPTLGCGFALWARFGIWDTSGAERFQSVVVQQCKNAVAIVFVFNVCDNESFQDINTWIELIKWKESKGNTMGILVGSQADLPMARRVITHEMGQALAYQMGLEYAEVSAKTGVNVEDTFNFITNTVCEQSNDFQVTEYQPLHTVPFFRRHQCWQACVIL
jgi:small GTP-binding protein